MQLSRRSAVGLVMMNALAATAGVHAQVQTQPPKQTPPSVPPASSSGMPDVNGSRQSDSSDFSPLTERMRISAERSHNEDRRKRMLADTEKLLALSTELKVYLEKTTRDELSMDVIRKANEIEKLAHDVQQRMKN